eukprot:TRINITY_DN7801_c0_g1_i1.p1 TRINITY_DN7801_c0_g1~~TRINITY_DN7801_c0_g1_i1.p1  ORF type:complete len:157 (-),score=37.36 TRINITY_DN7801_c0_g1_i1:116-586(-)
MIRQVRIHGNASLLPRNHEQTRECWKALPLDWRCSLTVLNQGERLASSDLQQQQQNMLDTTLRQHGFALSTKDVNKLQDDNNREEQKRDEKGEKEEKAEETEHGPEMPSNFGVYRIVAQSFDFYQQLGRYPIVDIIRYVRSSEVEADQWELLRVIP